MTEVWPFYQKSLKELRFYILHLRKPIEKQREKQIKIIEKAWEKQAKANKEGKNKKVTCGFDVYDYEKIMICLKKTQNW